MAGAHPPIGTRPQRPDDWGEAAVVRDPWRGWRLALPPVGPFVYPFPQAPPPREPLMRAFPFPHIHGRAPQRDELGMVGWYRPDLAVLPPQTGRQIPEEAVVRLGVVPIEYTGDELLGGDVRRRPGMNSNVPAAGK